MQCTKQTQKHKSAGSASGLKQYEVKWSLQMQTFQFHRTDDVVNNNNNNNDRLTAFDPGQPG